MASDPSSKQANPSAQNREDRLKAALKANMAKRKQQAKARKDQSAEKNTEKTGE